jgi:hypothetical protein
MITVTAPNGGENWLTGTNQMITWTPGNVTGNVKIELSRDGGMSFEVLFADTANDGSESWPVTGPATTQALVKITSLTDPSASDQSNAAFIISELCPAKTAAEGTPSEADTLALLYRFRDQVLSQTLRGQQYTRSFYQFSKEVVGILLSNPDLLLQTQQSLERFAPVIRALVDSGRATVRQADLLEIERLLTSYEAVGSPALRRTLEQLKQDIRSPRVQVEFRISVRL